MKKLLSLSGVFTLLLCSFIARSQSVSISDDGSAAAPSAMLEIKVSAPAKKGLLIPRMTSAERIAIASPAKGLLVYDSTSKNFWFQNGTAWQQLSSGAPNSWNISGTNIYNNNVGNIGIGVNSPKTKFQVVGNRTVLFGADTLSSEQGSQFVWFADKGALRMRRKFSDGVYPAPLPYNYSAIGAHSLAIGESAAGEESIAIGNAAHAWAHAFAQGFGVSAVGDGSFARGVYSSATGTLSFANGTDLQSIGDYSFTYGSGLIGMASNCFVVGRYNDPIAGSVSNDWIAKDPLFIIGNGIQGNESNAMVVLKNGVTGIGLNPTAEVSSWGMLQLKNVNGKDHLTMVQKSTNNRWGTAIPDGGVADLFLKYNGSPKGKFSNVNGAYTLVSDRRMKKDLTLVGDVLPGIVQLKAYTYHYVDNTPDDPLSHGFIAQDVAKLFPSFVSKVGWEKGKEMLGIDYNNFTVLAIKAIQEQQELITTQQQAIEKQQQQLEELLERLTALEKIHLNQ